MGRLAGFLRSRHNVAGCVLAAAGVGLYAAGVVAGLAALPVIAGLYVVGAVLVPRRRALDPYPQDATDTVDVGHALDELLRSMAGRLPADIFDKVASIRRSILLTLEHVAGPSVADPNVFVIRQTALTYLPEALNEYLAIPPGYRDRSLEGQRNPREVLIEQLGLMDQKMRDVAEAAVADDAEKLAVHGRFLADKFGGSTLDLRAADRAPGTGAALPIAADAVETAARETAARAAASEAARAGPARTAESAAADEEARQSAERRAVAARVAKAAQRASAIAAELSGSTPNEGSAPEHSAQTAEAPEPAHATESAAEQAAEYKSSLDRIRG